MEYLQWAARTSTYEDVQETINKKVVKLVDTYFSSADEYTIEKFVKTFCESIYNLERLLLFGAGLHPSQLNKGIKLNAQEALKKSDDIKKTILTEIERQFRNYNTFMPNIAKLQ